MLGDGVIVPYDGLWAGFDISLFSPGIKRHWSSPSAFSFRLFPECVMTETWIAVVHTFGRVPTAQGKQGKCPKRIPCQGKHREFEKSCQNTGNFVCSSCKFPDFKGKRYFEICHENLQIIFEA